MKERKAKENKKKYPIASFGFGIDSYVKLLYNLVRMIAIASIPAIALMVVYYKSGTVEGMPFLTKLSLGSLRGADVLCVNQFLGNSGA